MLQTFEKFQSAALELASSGPIKRRLFGAYVNHLATLTDEQLPKEIREDFYSFSRAMRAVRPMPGEDEVTATVRKMSDGDANRYAAQIVTMLGIVVRSQVYQRSPAGSPVARLYAAEA